MRQYAKISTSLWVSSQKWKTLSGDNAKLLYFYLHTCTHSTPIGTYVLPLAYASADLSWEDPELERAMVELEEAGLVVYDRDESVVHLPGALLVDPPTNTKHAQGMASAIKRLPVSVCRDLCVAEFLSLSNTEAFQDPLQSLSKGFRKPFDRTGTGKERKGTGTVPEDPPTPLPPNVGGGRDGSLETDKEAKDGTDTTATTMSEMVAIAKAELEAWNRDFPETTKGLRDELQDQNAFLQLQRREGKTVRDFARWRRYLKDEGKVPRFYQRPREYIRPTKNGTGLEMWAVVEAQIAAQGSKRSPEPITTTHPPAWRPT